MSVKKSTTPSKKAPVAAKPAKQSAAPVTAPKKERKPTVRKAPMDRAIKRARLLDKNASAMLRLVSNWKGEATVDQQSTNADIVARLRQIATAAEQVLLATDMLATSGFEPTEGRAGSGKEPLAAGARVAIKEKHFNSALYKNNDFEVVLDAGKQVRIRPAGDLRAPQVDVNRNWLDILDSTDVDDDPALDVEGDANNEDEANQ